MPEKHQELFRLVTFGTCANCGRHLPISSFDLKDEKRSIKRSLLHSGFWATCSLFYNLCKDCRKVKDNKTGICFKPKTHLISIRISSEYTHLLPSVVEWFHT